MKKVLAIFLTVFLFLLVVPPILVRGQYANPYSVSGYVFDDLNANGVQDGGERGIPGMMVYADNTYGFKAYTDQTGYFRIDNLPNGTHSIEIANAGELGSRPTSSEKISVLGPRGDLRYGVQKGGYAVEGYVRDQNGHPIAGTTVYVDFPSRQTAITNNFGYYRIEDVGYDSSTPHWGFSGGHNIYVQGYDANPVLVNPQYATSSLPTNFTVRSDQEAPGCSISAYDPVSRQCISNVCSIPSGWVQVGNCAGYNNQPGYGQCSTGPVGTPTYDCNSSQQYCTTTRYQRSDCSTYDQTSCQYIVGQCGYQTGSGGGQCTLGQRVGSAPACDSSQRSCTIYTYTRADCSQYQGGLEDCQYISGRCGYGWYRTFGDDQTGFITGDNTQLWSEPSQTWPQPVNEPAPTWDNSWNTGNTGYDQYNNYDLNMYQPQPSQIWSEPTDTWSQPDWGYSAGYMDNGWY